MTLRRVTLLLQQDAKKESGLKPHENPLFISHLVWEKKVLGVSLQSLGWKGIMALFFGAT